MSAAWLGHATTLLRLGNQWVLTDPVFSDRIGLRVGPHTFGVGRRTPILDPALLPPIDLILISHAHFDHLDVPSLRRLASARTRVVTASGTAGLIPKGFGGVLEVPWQGETTVGDLTIRALRPNHWGARTLWDKHRKFNSYVIETPAHRVLFAGDTALSEAYDAVGRGGGVDLSIFGIGAYNPWVHAHATPEQALTMHRAAGGEWLMPVHHSTFELSDEPLDEPLHRLRAALTEGEWAKVVGTQIGKLWTPGTERGASPEADPDAAK